MRILLMQSLWDALYLLWSWLPIISCVCVCVKGGGGIKLTPLMSVTFPSQVP